MRWPWMIQWTFKYGDETWDRVIMPGYYPVPFYKDITGMYTDEECDDDNCVEIPVPEDLLWEWFTTESNYSEDEDGEAAYLTRDDLVKWVYEESICDETIWLFEWLQDHKFFWKRLD